MRLSRGLLSHRCWCERLACILPTKPRAQRRHAACHARPLNGLAVENTLAGRVKHTKVGFANTLEGEVPRRSRLA
jgi:hypothetical protein